MRVCTTCGQPVPIRWRNIAPPIRIAHVAGPVISISDMNRRYYGRGYVVDRVQACVRCTAEIVRGRWGAFFPPGADIIELGELNPVMYEGVDAQAIPCQEPGPEADGAAAADPASQQNGGRRRTRRSRQSVPEPPTT